VRTRCSSCRPGEVTKLRRAAVLAAVAAVMVSAGLSQKPDAPAAPQKPLRERLLERALKGDAQAQFDLAKGYEGGRFGLTQDYSQAKHWYEEAANQSEPFAEASLGIFYGAGKGVKQDYALAYKWLDRSASHLTGSDRDTVVEMRDSIGRRMTPSQLESARRAASAAKAASKN
jgi:TPR repeat protein